jgi:4-diphosphocytidyl-2-C-methyl-D-erythritol kinase
MLFFPNCKINLGLHISNKRADGFHEIATVFYPVTLKDAVEIIPLRHSTKEVVFTASGLTVDGDQADNSCIKAYHLLKKDFPALPAIQLHLHKAIPMGAGMGGGSADGAFTLQLLNQKFNLNLSPATLLDYALQLGSDCPFFIINKPCYATGRGEILEEIDLDLSKYVTVLVNPHIHVNTGWAFAQLSISGSGRFTRPEPFLNEAIRQPIDTWKNILENDFERPVFEKYPVIKNIKETLYAQGAIYAAMSGSGSTVFGIFEKSTDVSTFEKNGYFVKQLIN